MIRSYCFIDPIGTGSNGISSYIDNALRVLWGHGIDSRVLSSKVHALGGNRAEFERLIMDSLHPGEMIELPDSRGVFGGGGGPDTIHVRLHGPIAYLQYLNRQSVDWGRWRYESSLIGRASYLSSPTRSNWDRYLESGISVSGGVRFFSNPVPEMRLDSQFERDIDVLFLGRLERLKGLDLFLKMIDRLPSGLRIVVAGVSESDLPAEVLCYLAGKVSFYGPVDDVVKFRLLQRVRVCVVTSRFESFSMVTAEAISCGCHVIAWRCGGMAEAFPVELVRFVDVFDIDRMALDVIESLSKDRLDVDCRIDFIRAVNTQYATSIKEILSSSSSFVSMADGFSSEGLYNDIYDSQKRLGYLVRFRRKCLKFFRNPVRFVVDFFRGKIKS